jgi:hypothetical protein
MLKGDGREFISNVVQKGRIPQQSGCAESYSLPNRKIHGREKKKQSFL